VSDVVDLRPLRLFGAKTLAEPAVWEARKKVMNRASKNVHYNCRIAPVNSVLKIYFPASNQTLRCSTGEPGWQRTFLKRGKQHICGGKKL
jgi:hypothetical protein